MLSKLASVIVTAVRNIWKYENICIKEDVRLRSENYDNIKYKGNIYSKGSVINNIFRLGRFRPLCNKTKSVQHLRFYNMSEADAKTVDTFPSRLLCVPISHRIFRKGFFTNITT